MSASLETLALTKSFGALKVTDGVDLSVAPGELHAIIGPNGAGKTTLVAQLSGQLRPDSGAVVLDGETITRLDMAARVEKGMARSFQITTVLPAMTALENVALAVQARSGSSFRFWRPASADRAVTEGAMAALDEVGLADRAQVEARALSHGERRQLEIAVALATAPRLLLLDEPLAGAGGPEVETLVALMQQLKSRMTIILVEHDMDAVFALADRVSVLVYGQLIATGAPAAIRADPAVRAAYLGEEA